MMTTAWGICACRCGIQDERFVMAGDESKETQEKSSAVESIKAHAQEFIDASWEDHKK